MKKLRLKAMQLGATEVLSREQLRKVMGGDGSDTSVNECVAWSCGPQGNGTCKTGVGGCECSDKEGNC